MRVSQTSTDQSVADRVAAEVRAEMARQNLSQQALASKLGWLQNRLSRRITDGKTSVPFTIGELTAVAQALGVPVTQFISETERAA